ncbi:MAG TPA: hypothetical protein VK808_13080 [Bacteroidia bacterium]|jgi:hypothetical protein|nr:hypothetical protein [Bacteroidia bacterium]
MKTKTIGSILIALGIVMMIYTGFNFITTKKVVDIGSIQVNQKEDHPVQWSPILGAIMLVGGIIVVVASNKKVV